ncbi:MAG: (d)CMP kinase [bacterium]|nr:(d)CMP kinase [bacterium]
MSSNQKNIVIALDGPAASGKSTIAQIIAQKLNFLYIDSGAMYRAFTWKMMQNNINIDNNTELNELINNTHLVLKKGFSIKVYVDSLDITTKIRDPEIDRNISIVAKNDLIRKALVKLQRSYQKNYNIVMDGRDIGTIVFPKANYKFYLEASIEVRAMRRFQELIAKGKEITLEKIIKEMQNRDHADFTRTIGPLKCAKDAFRIDTSELSIEQVASLVLNCIKNKGNKS